MNYIQNTEFVKDDCGEQRLNRKLNQFENKALDALEALATKVQACATFEDAVALIQGEQQVKQDVKQFDYNRHFNAKTEILNPDNFVGLSRVSKQIKLSINQWNDKPNTEFWVSVFVEMNIYDDRMRSHNDIEISLTRETWQNRFITMSKEYHAMGNGFYYVIDRQERKTVFKTED